jgi:hypothetical protein
MLIIVRSARRQGVAFDQAWSVAIAEVPKSGWRTRDAIEWTRKPGGAPTCASRRPPPERKLLRVAQALAELEAERMARERRLHGQVHRCQART